MPWSSRKQPLDKTEFIAPMNVNHMCVTNVNAHVQKSISIHQIFQILF